MKATHVETKQTPIAGPDVRDLFREVLSAANKGAVSERAVTLLTAQSALETGHWKHLYNWNFANLKAGEDTSGFYMNLRNVREVIDGSEKWFSPEGEIDDRDGVLVGEEYPVPPGHPQTRFRAYQSAQEGAMALVARLMSKYPNSWHALLNDSDAEKYARALKSEKYYTASEKAYATALEKLVLQYSIPDDVPGLPGGLTVGQPEFERDRKRWVLPLFFSEQ
jgi:hypothetical protein